MPDKLQAAGRENARLFVFDAWFLTQPRLRRILSLAGYKIRLGLPGSHDLAADLFPDRSNSPAAQRGLKIAAKRDAKVLLIENTFLGALHPGHPAPPDDPPMGLCLDRKAVHFDATTPSELETLLATAPLDDTALLNRARAAMARMREHSLGKYSGFDPALPAPAPGYVLVVDQPLGATEVTASGGNRAAFLEMLVFAQEEHPGARVIIKTGPKSVVGHYTARDASTQVSLFRAPVSPWALLEGAVAVYTYSSHLGFEAIIAGHKPRVFGQPFYAGWGLTQDENPVARRERRLTKAQLFGAAMIKYPTWYDPFQDRLCPLETVLDNLEARARAWREDHLGWVASGMRRWKRKPINRFFGREVPVIFSNDLASQAHADRRQMVWAGRAGQARRATKPDQPQAVRVEDGFIRSRGLGAELVPPLSLVCDDLGIYYDPRQPSRLEVMIDARAVLTDTQRLRAERLLARLIAARISKYNLGGARPEIPAGHRILVPGQVEDDASIRTGATTITSNLDLLRAARTAHPKAVIIYKPHPDVEAGLRIGAVEDAGKVADVVASHADPVGLLGEVDEVWTMTSLLGFEALLRGVKVTTLGVPFYAGWGLTTDHGEVPSRRRARPDLLGLLYATLIDYPRYFDPITGLPCPVEVAVERLATGRVGFPGLANLSLSKLQGLLSAYAHLWR